MDGSRELPQNPTPTKNIPQNVPFIKKDRHIISPPFGCGGFFIDAANRQKIIKK